MTANNEHGPDATTVAHVASMLKTMKQTGLGLGQDEDCFGESADQRAFTTALALRKAAGQTLPFLFDEATADFPKDQTHWYAHTKRMDHELFLCDRYGLDSPYIYDTFDTPEGRHLAFNKLFQEVVGCARANGWSLERKRIFALLSSAEYPANGRELILARFGSLMLRAPEETLSSNAVEKLYNRILEGIDLVVGDSKGGESRADLERRRSILKAVCEESSNRYPEHPLIRAIVAFKAIVILHPFQVANLFMARLLFSWILFEAGMSTASLLPFIDFLNQWECSSQPARQAYRPYAPHASVAQNSGNSHDWTAYLETVLEFVAHELNGLSSKLYGFRLRRLRLAEMLDDDKSTNARQKEVLIEALVHEDAEFSYAQFMDQFKVTYATAYGDLGNLEERGYLQVKKKGKQAYFIAASHIRDRIHDHLKAVSPSVYDTYYDENGRLRELFAEARTEASRLENPTFERRNVFDAAFPLFDFSRAYQTVPPP